MDDVEGVEGEASMGDGDGFLFGVGEGESDETFVGR